MKHAYVIRSTEFHDILGVYSSKQSALNETKHLEYDYLEPKDKTILYPKPRQDKYGILYIDIINKKNHKDNYGNPIYIEKYPLDNDKATTNNYFNPPKL